MKKKVTASYAIYLNDRNVNIFVDADMWAALQTNAAWQQLLRTPAQNTSDILAPGQGWYRCLAAGMWCATDAAEAYRKAVRICGKVAKQLAAG